MLTQTHTYAHMCIHIHMHTHAQAHAQCTHTSFILTLNGYSVFQSQCLATTAFFSITIILWLWEFCINGITQYTILWNRLFALYPWGPAKITIYISSFPFSLLSNISWHGKTIICIFIHPLKNIWVISSFQLLQTMLLETVMYSFTLCVCKPKFLFL